VTARQLVAGWRYALVAIALVAAAVTPTVDPVNMGLVMLPLTGLYAASIGLAALMGRR
jgi:sec-independent protein translocase protein TatC